MLKRKDSIKYLLGLINSNLLKYYFGFIRVMTAGGAFTLKHATIQQLPIRLAENQNLFLEKVDKILSLKYEGKDTTAIEQEIDNIIYKLYELTYEEVKVIDPEFSLIKKEYEAMEIN
jgi:adenine-specific DNA-methyltransferase